VPLTPAFATTGYKAQGDTLEELETSLAFSKLKRGSNHYKWTSLNHSNCLRQRLGHVGVAPQAIGALKRAEVLVDRACGKHSTIIYSDFPVIRKWLLTTGSAFYAGLFSTVPPVSVAPAIPAVASSSTLVLPVLSAPRFSAAPGQRKREGVIMGNQRPNAVSWLLS
jgi:hypothetical protein